MEFALTVDSGWIDHRLHLRRDKHHTVWSGAQRYATDFGAIYDRFISDVWVCTTSIQEVWNMLTRS